MRLFLYEHISAGGLGPKVPVSLLREGRAMRDAVCGDFRRLGVDVVTSGDFRVTAVACDWTLVIAPEFDHILLNCAQAVLDVGGRLLGSMPEAIRLTADKLALASWWQERGVATPGTAQALNEEAVVLKPRFGAGSQATFLLRVGVELARDAARREWPGEFIVQQYVEGQAASVALLMGERQTIPLLPGRQHLSDDGRFRYLGGSLPLPEPLATRAVNLALQAVAGIDGLRGYVGVDLVLGDDGRDYAIEINPRVTTSYLGLRRLCQQNLAELMLQLAHGETVPQPTWQDGVVEFRP